MYIISVAAVLQFQRLAFDRIRTLSCVAVVAKSPITKPFYHFDSKFILSLSFNREVMFFQPCMVAQTDIIVN